MTIGANMSTPCGVCHRDPRIPVVLLRIRGRLFTTTRDPIETVVDRCGSVFHKNCVAREVSRTNGAFNCPNCLQALDISGDEDLRARIWSLQHPYLVKTFSYLDKISSFLKNTGFFNWETAAIVGVSVVGYLRTGLAAFSVTVITTLYFTQDFRFVSLSRDEVRSLIMNFIGCAAAYNSAYPYIKNQFLKGFPVETVLVATLGRECFKYLSEGKKEKATQALIGSVVCLSAALTRESSEELALFLFLAFTVNERFQIAHLLPTAGVFFIASMVHTFATGVLQ